MKDYASQFTRLGSRNYIQGGDLIAGCLTALDHWKLDSPNSLKASCHKMVLTQGYYRLAATNSSTEDYAAIFDITNDALTQRIGFIADPDNVVVASTPYDEDAVITGAAINEENQCINFNWQQQETPVQKVLIALQKSLLNRLYPAPENRWIFYQCDFNWREMTQKTEANININIQQMLGQRIAKCQIQFDNQSLGSQCFIKVKKS